MAPTANDKIRSESLDRLFSAILTLQNVEECYDFFVDVCTVHEMKAMAQRLDVAAMLTEARTYLDIGEATGASTATISRVNRCLRYGSDGYQLVFSRIKPE